VKEWVDEGNGVSLAGQFLSHEIGGGNELGTGIQENENSVRVEIPAGFFISCLPD
jgi:hypothetical protein